MFALSDERAKWKIASRLEKKPLLIAVNCLAGLAIFFFGDSTYPTAMVYLYTFVFGATWLTVPWLYPAEIFPLKVRAKGSAWGVVGWSLGNGSLTLALPYIFGSIDENTLHVFGAVNLIMWALYPESSRRTLEEMDLLFAAESPWVWTAESNFATLIAENPDLGAARQGIEVEKGWNGAAEHQETVRHG
ncbi:hypothetical protein BDV25DRAFT_135502 [Aspergillus avenaceus]|uniref:Major facilitator superfamily (MFS) profile domain-containing protein n=1 Tax=Aspergillus avenaceus TaxID=36643 RepID=A0A5N6U8E7_ASPAV|nr:hypothetical protein BDV25DRAFT_135502 [Aspergillus avenaceus]